MFLENMKDLQANQKGCGCSETIVCPHPPTPVSVMILLSLSSGVITSGGLRFIAAVGFLLAFRWAVGMGALLNGGTRGTAMLGLRSNYLQGRPPLFS